MEKNIMVIVKMDRKMDKVPLATQMGILMLANGRMSK